MLELTGENHDRHHRSDHLLGGIEAYRTPTRYVMGFLPPNGICVVVSYLCEFTNDLDTSRLCCFLKYQLSPKDFEVRIETTSGQNSNLPLLFWLQTF